MSKFIQKLFFSLPLLSIKTKKKDWRKDGVNKRLVQLSSGISSIHYQGCKLHKCQEERLNVVDGAWSLNYGASASGFCKPACCTTGEID
jgi:hypothetical protein